jgi:hypothetical protein
MHRLPPPVASSDERSARGLFFGELFGGQDHVNALLLQ